MNSNDINKLLKICSALSSDLFRNSLYVRYSKQQNKVFTIDNYDTTCSNEFQERFPVIISTTHSILNSISEPLDYIVIDESSQVDIITASLAFSVCRNVVIVGDTRQLPHIVNDKVREESERLAEQFNIPSAFDYVKQNIIESLLSLYDKSMPQTLLREHYRCNPLIIGFCNQKFYKGGLILMKDEPSANYSESSYPLRIFRTVQGLHGHNKINERQISVIRDEILPQCASILPEQIGIISPYRNQADKNNRRNRQE